MGIVKLDGFGYNIVHEGHGMHSTTRSKLCFALCHWQDTPFSFSDKEIA
jgi:hypothetical protein